METSEQLVFLETLRLGKPYFGLYMRAFQGLYERHIYMQSLIQHLSKTTSWKELSLLEIGSWAGGSTVTWAKAIQKYFKKGSVTCIDHWEPYFDLSKNKESDYQQMNAAALNGGIFELFKHNVKACGVDNMVIPIVGSSVKVLSQLPLNQFHVIFIDGSHLYRDVRDDILASKPLICEKGILCGDDLELQTSMIDVRGMQQYIKENKEYCRDVKTDQSYHPGVTAAVHESFGEVASWDGFWAVQKVGNSWEKIFLNEKIETDLDHFSKGYNFQLKLIGQMDQYNIVMANQVFIAVAQQLGPIDLFNESVGEREIPPLIFRADSLEEIKNSIAEKGINTTFKVSSAISRTSKPFVKKIKDIIL